MVMMRDEDTHYAYGGEAEAFELEEDEDNNLDAQQETEVVEHQYLRIDPTLRKKKIAPQIKMPLRKRKGAEDMSSSGDECLSNVSDER